MIKFVLVCGALVLDEVCAQKSPTDCKDPLRDKITANSLPIPEPECASNDAVK